MAYSSATPPSSVRRQLRRHVHSVCPPARKSEKPRGDRFISEPFATSSVRSAQAQASLDSERPEIFKRDALGGLAQDRPELWLPRPVPGRALARRVWSTGRTGSSPQKRSDAHPGMFAAAALPAEVDESTRPACSFDCFHGGGTVYSGPSCALPPRRAQRWLRPFSFCSSPFRPSSRALLFLLSLCSLPPHLEGCAHNKTCARAKLPPSSSAKRRLVVSGRPFFCAICQS